MGKRKQIKFWKVIGLMAGLFLSDIHLPAFSAEPFAVVELFSSEGCSSCPPADWLLGEIRQRAQANNERIFVLSFQVDYWNYLGWVDPFSRPEFTRRQYAYAKVFKGSSVYTPQMIINGKHVLVGSDRSMAHAVITEELRLTSSHDLTIKASRIQDGQIQVDYSCDLSDGDLHVALVEGDLESHVTAGENNGRTLSHVNVVRQLKTISPVSKQGRAVMALDGLSLVGQYAVIGFVQDKGNRAIRAVASVNVGLN